MRRKHQLQLPGLAPPKEEPRLTAKRDLTEAAFDRALVRHRFAYRGPVAFLDLTTSCIVDAVCRIDPLRVARRATLAKLIRSRRLAERGQNRV